jgi:SAM-dependent methyltransferase
MQDTREADLWTSAPPESSRPETEPDLPHRLGLLSMELHVLPKVRGPRVCEIGCGTGGVSAWLAWRGYDVTALEACPKALEQARAAARRLGRDIAFLQGSLSSLQHLAPGAFDWVLDAAQFAGLTGPLRAQALAEVRRVLKPGGVFHLRAKAGGAASESTLRAELGASGFNVLATMTHAPAKVDGDEELLLVAKSRAVPVKLTPALPPGER